MRAWNLILSALIVVMFTIIAVLGWRLVIRYSGETGAGAATAMPSLEPPQGAELTVTCGVEVRGRTSDVFGAGLMIPRWVGNDHEAIRWGRDFLAETAPALRDHISHIRKVSGTKYFLRFGHQPFDGWVSRVDGTTHDGYHWRDALSPESEMMSIDEYVAYSRHVGAEPQVVVNFGTGSSREAADLVAYANGTDPSDPMVALRQQRGYVEPFGITLWEIGNEQYGPWAAGNDHYPGGRRGQGSSNPAAYSKRVNEFAHAMRARSPSPVRILAPLNNWELEFYGEAGTRRIIAASAEALDGYVIHFYPYSESEPVFPGKVMGSSYRFEVMLEAARQLVDSESGGKKMEIAITEWSPTSYPTEMGRTWITGLLTVDTLKTMARAGVSVANYFATATPPEDPGGYSYWLSGDVSRPAPSLVATAETAAHLGPDLLETTVSGSPLATSATRVAGQFEYPRVAAQCSQGSSARYLVVVNRGSLPEEVGVSLGIHAAAPIRQVTLSSNPFAQWVERSEAEFLQAESFSLSLPPYSAAFLTAPSAPSS